MVDTKEFMTFGTNETLSLKKYLGSKEHVIIPEDFVRISQHAFSSCVNVKKVTIPSTVKTISDRAFMGLESLVEVEFSEGLELIDSEAFRGCKNLEKANLPNSLKELVGSTFSYCEKLEKIKFGKKIKTIGPCVAYRCNSIQSLVIPEQVQSLGEINGMAGLTSLIIESDLKKTKSLNIFDCKNLTEVVFKKGFPNLKGLLFASCPKLEQVTIGDEVYRLNIENGIGTIVQKEKSSKPVSNDPVEFIFNEKYGHYECEFKGIMFVTDQKPDDNYKNNVRLFAQNYTARFDGIVEFMLPDLNSIYGKVTAKDVMAKLGKPTIDLGRWTLSYLEQSFDTYHIFEMEFMDEEFEVLSNFVIDG